MPDSHPHGKADLLDWFQRLGLEGARILDVGAGSGVYGRMFRDQTNVDQIIGIEIFEPYVDRYNLKDHYTGVVVADVHTFVLCEWGDWHLVVFGDVLEHWTGLEAVSIVQQAISCSRWVAISVPLGEQPQGEVNGNPYERHITTWRHASIMAAWPEAKRLDDYDENDPDATAVGMYVVPGDVK